jgi:hypothetical protein
MSDLLIDIDTLNKAKYLGFSAEVNWFEIENWLWEKYGINAREISIESCLGWYCQLGILGGRDKSDLFHNSIVVSHHSSPIEAKVKMLRKCIAFLHERNQVEVSKLN